MTSGRTISAEEQDRPPPVARRDRGGRGLGVGPRRGFSRLVGQHRAVTLVISRRPEQERQPAVSRPRRRPAPRRGRPGRSSRTPSWPPPPWGPCSGRWSGHPRRPAPRPPGGAPPPCRSRCSPQSSRARWRRAGDRGPRSGPSASSVTSVAEEPGGRRGGGPERSARLREHAAHRRGEPDCRRGRPAAAARGARAPAAPSC